jgi:hypothetical protein
MCACLRARMCMNEDQRCILNACPDFASARPDSVYAITRADGTSICRVHTMSERVDDGTTLPEWFACALK